MIIALPSRTVARKTSDESVPAGYAFSAVAGNGGEAGRDGCATVTHPRARSETLAA
ncbi:hypothetical protein [Halostella pelagica]|uniref:hypothetical protein n=1 Tax=Halostella pelagica TaxID=2583824 RepID=UPI0013876661|nr:hypothetical protein [Halostella pelagica]